MAESSIGLYRRRQPNVVALRHRGGFPLDFLRPDEQVRHGGEGAAEIVEAQSPHARLALVKPGQWLVRLPGHRLEVVDSETFDQDYEEVSADG